MKEMMPEHIYHDWLIVTQEEEFEDVLDKSATLSFYSKMHLERIDCEEQ